MVKSSIISVTGDGSDLANFLANHILQFELVVKRDVLSRQSLSFQACQYAARMFIVVRKW